MATPANLTYSQIETRVMNNLRIPTTNATEQAKVQALINEVYRDIYEMQDWWFLVKRAVVNTVAKVTAGTANVTNLSTSVTLSTAPAAGLGSFVGYVFTITGDTNDSLAVYRIATHTAGGTAITLDANFTGATNATATYRIYQDTIPVAADVGKLLKPKRYGYGTASAYSWSLGVTPVGVNEMMDYKIADVTEGKPVVCCLWDFTTTGDPTTARTMVVHPYPDKTYRVEYFYKQQLNTELSGSTQPFIPDEARQVLVYRTLALGYPIFLNDVDRGQFFNQQYQTVLNGMMAAQREYEQARPSVSPKEYLRIRQRQRRGVATTLGGLFDSWPIRP